MKRVLTLYFLLLFLCAIALLCGLNGCSGFSSAGSSSANSLQGKFQHVVIIVQENRTPDNLFHDPVLIARGADIASSGVNSSGQIVPLTPVPRGINYDLNHSHASFVAMFDGGKMDGADKIPIGCNSNPCPTVNQGFHYVEASDVSPYFQLAEQYAFGDRMFQTNQGPSFPAHQFLLSGTSAPTATSKMFVAENTFPAYGSGCASPPQSFVNLIDPDGNEAGHWMYPCFEHPTLTDGLNQSGISWKYYTYEDGYIGSLWTAPNAIQHMCVPNAPPPNATACTGPDWVNNVIPYTTENPAPVLSDIANGKLSAVSWVIPTAQNSDHAGSTIWTGGPSWVASIVNAIGNSQYWANTAIIITWDDWGGWYDHVAPPALPNDGTGWGAGYVYGFRVPLIVVAPYAKTAYISHLNHDFGSILNFTEQVFGLASLGYADSRADNLADCFDFSQTPLTFQTIEAPLDAQHFLNDHSVQEAPDTE